MARRGDNREQGRSSETPVSSSRKIPHHGVDSGPALPEDDDDPPSRVEHARKYERDAAAKLRELITRSEDLYAQAVRKLAAFESSLEARRATLRRLGYLGEKGRRPRE